MEQSKHDFYSSAKVDFPELADNEQFRSVKNMIIKAVSEINKKALPDVPEAVPTEDSFSADEEVNDDTIAGAAFGLLVSLSRIIRDDYNKEYNSLSAGVDRKLRKTISAKELENGVKHG